MDFYCNNRLQNSNIVKLFINQYFKMFIEKLRKKNNKSKIEAKPAYEELNPKATTTTTNILTTATATS